MTNKVATACLAACLLAGTAAATAGGDTLVVGMYEKYRNEQQRFMDDELAASLQLNEPEMIRALLRTLHRLSRYPVPAKPPRVVYLSATRLQQMACEQPCNVRGHYAGGREIYLDERLQPLSDLFDRSILLHEMVHYLQQQEAGREPADGLDEREKCRLWHLREQEAYALQEAFLSLVGSPAKPGYSPLRPAC